MYFSRSISYHTGKEEINRLWLYNFIEMPNTIKIIFGIQDFPTKYYLRNDVFSAMGEFNKENIHRVFQFIHKLKENYQIIIYTNKTKDEMKELEEELNIAMLLNNIYNNILIICRE